MKQDKTFNLRIVTPTGSEEISDVIYVAAETALGEMVILSGHAAYVMDLVPCLVHVQIAANNGSETRSYFIGNGTFKIENESYVILADELYPAGAVDKNFLSSYHDHNIAHKIAKNLKIDL